MYVHTHTVYSNNINNTHTQYTQGYDTIACTYTTIVQYPLHTVTYSNNQHQTQHIVIPIVYVSLLWCELCLYQECSEALFDFLQLVLLLPPLLICSLSNEVLKSCTALLGAEQQVALVKAELGQFLVPSGEG